MKQMERNEGGADICTEKTHIRRFEQGVLTDFEEILLTEDAFTLFLDGAFFAKFTCTGKNIKELAVGHLFCMGVIQSPKEVKMFSIQEKPGEIYVETPCEKPLVPNRSSEKEAVPESNYGIMNKMLADLNYNAIVAAFKEFQEYSPLFKQTGSAHSAALFDQKYNICYFFEDVGRHNAVDKVIGRALMDGFCFRNSMLMTSSRMPLELIKKAKGCNIPVVMSISAPTAESVRFARENRIVLIGMFRGNRINVYS